MTAPNPHDAIVTARTEARVGSRLSNWNDIVDLAERAEAAYETHGKAAARKMVLDKVDYEAVSAAIRNGDELTRRKSLALLHCWDAAQAAEELVRVLHDDPCPVVRHEAAYYLAALKRRETVGDLIAALSKDSVDLVRHEAAEALGDMGAIEAIPALRIALKDRSEIVAKTARIAIQQLSRAR